MLKWAITFLAMVVNSAIFAFGYLAAMPVDMAHTVFAVIIYVAIMAAIITIVIHASKANTADEWIEDNILP